MKLTPKQISKLPPVELKVDHHYLTRDGSVTTIQQIDAEYDDEQCYCSDGRSRALNGKWILNNNLYEHDLIAEIQITVPALAATNDRAALIGVLHTIVTGIPDHDLRGAAREALISYEHLPTRS